MKSTKKVFISLITLAGILSGILLFPQVGEAVYPQKTNKIHSTMGCRR
jgi:hypothetical protein